MVKQLKKYQKKELEMETEELFNSLLREDLERTNERLKKVYAKNTNNQ
jgi:hypothetical protein